MKQTTLKNIKPAKRYASALFETIQDNNLENVLDEIKNVFYVIKENKDVQDFLLHPVVSIEDKKDVILKSFPDLSNVCRNFLFILIDENRLNCLGEIIGFLEDYINSKNNLLNLNVTLAIEADNNLKETIKKRLESKFQSRVNAEFGVDPSILGGMLIKMNDTVIDLSIKKKLESFKKI